MDEVTPDDSLTYSADTALADPSGDQLGRAQFARHVANGIARRHNPSSLTVGLYGPWGSGKTTVLNFIAHELRTERNVLVVRFEPWLVASENDLIGLFFGTLGRALNTWRSPKNKVAGLLQQYGGVLSMPIVGISINAKEAGNALASINLEDHRAEIEGILRREKVQIVVMIDDIDRLDRREIQAVFKLVKLTASFPYMTYILSFDQEMVAKALAERYGGGAMSDGMQFLEKIVQVPINLPPASIEELWHIVSSGVDEVLTELKVALSQSMSMEFARLFTGAFSAALTTPRLAVRYLNAISFALPVLQGEVHPCELMLLEGLRLFYPRAYAAVRDNQQVFVPTGHRQGEEQARACIDLTTQACEGLNPEQSAAALNLLIALFPRIGSYYGRTGYGGEWVDRWTQDKRVASPSYFGRFFTYGISRSDVPDAVVDQIIAEAGEDDRPAADIIEGLGAILSAYSPGVLVRKMRSRTGTIPGLAAVKLAESISKLGAEWDSGGVSFLFDSTWTQACWLVSGLVASIDDPALRFKAAEAVATAAEPLAFALDSLRWVGWTAEERKAGYPDLAEDQLKHLRDTLASRIAHQALSAGVDFFSPRRPFAAQMLEAWGRWGEPQQARTFLAEAIAQYPGAAVDLVRSFRAQAVNLNTGLPFLGALDDPSYRRVTSLIPADILLSVFKAEFPHVTNSEEDVDNGADSDEANVRMFLRSHIRGAAQP